LNRGIYEGRDRRTDRGIDRELEGRIDWWIDEWIDGGIAPVLSKKWNNGEKILTFCSV
jgi:hypothetical protein